MYLQGQLKITSLIRLGLLEWLEMPLYYKNSQGENPICSTRDEISQPSRPISPRAATAAHNWAEAQHWAQCCSLNNWISHWCNCEVSCFHWTTLMHDTLDITGAGYEWDFIWLYTGYSILVQWKDTTQVYNSGVTDGGARVRTSPLTSKCKNWVPILFIFRHSVLFWFSVSCFWRFSEVFGLLFSGDFAF